MSRRDEQLPPRFFIRCAAAIIFRYRPLCGSYQSRSKGSMAEFLGIRRFFCAIGFTIDIPAFSKEADKIYPVSHQIELLRRWWLFPHSSKCNVMRCATERFLALENVALFSAFSLWNLLIFITVKMHALFLLEEVFHRHTDVFRWDDLDAR